MICTRLMLEPLCGLREALLGEEALTPATPSSRPGEHQVNLLTAGGRSTVIVDGVPAIETGSKAQAQAIAVALRRCDYAGAGAPSA